MISCPANYFGKGEDYNLKDDPAELEEFNRLFDEYSQANPDDPTGEKALEAFKAQVLLASKTELPPPQKKTPEYVSSPSVVDEPPQPEMISVEEDHESIRLELTASRIIFLKRYSAYRRMRPRDVISFLIDKHIPKIQIPP